MYHISDLRHYLKCPRCFYLNSNRQQYSRFISNLRTNVRVDKLLREKFKIKRLFVGQPNDSSEVFFEALKHYSWFYNARIEINGLRFRLPLLNKRTDGSYDVYFVVLLPNPMSGDVLFYTQTIKALTDIGFTIKNVSVVHLNPDYKRYRKLKYDKVLVVSKHFYNENHQANERIAWWINKRVVDHSEDILAMSECQLGDLPERADEKICFRKPHCEFCDFCYPDHNSRENRVVSTQQEYAQLMTSVEEPIFVDDLALKPWLKSNFQFPLAFVDFEWDTFSIPPYRRMKPLDVIPFQYSLDILEENGNIKHFDFLATGDTRFTFMDSLLRRLPKKGSIVVFNAEGGEKLRLNDLKRQFPFYSHKIDLVLARIVDISLPFNFGTVYHYGMKGSYSLKSIVKAIKPTAYEDMAVSSGREAFLQWRLYEQTHREDLRDELLQYCRQDTQSLMDIYHFLQEIVKQ